LPQRARNAHRHRPEQIPVRCTKCISGRQSPGQARIRSAERAKSAHRVAREEQCATEGAQRLRPLADRDFDPASLEGERRGEPGDAAAITQAVRIIRPWARALWDGLGRLGDGFGRFLV